MTNIVLILTLLSIYLALRVIRIAKKRQRCLSKADLRRLSQGLNIRHKRRGMAHIKICAKCRSKMEAFNQ